MGNEVGRLRARILERHASVHAFCRAHPELKRATVYLVLSGNYPGNLNEQVAKIKAALDGVKAAEKRPAMGTASRYAHRPPQVDGETVVKALQTIRCAHCRRLDRRECLTCREQTEREGTELYNVLFAAEPKRKETAFGDADVQEK